MSKQLFVVATLVAALAITVFLIRPAYQELQEVDFKVKKKRAELENLEKYYSELQEADSNLKNHKEQLAKVDSALPSQPDLPSMFNFFQNTADQEGLILMDVGSISVAPLHKEKNRVSPVKTIEMNLEAIGSYNAFKKFVSEVEKSASLIEVKNITFTSKERTKEKGEEKKSPFGVEFSLETHFYNPNQNK